MILFASYGRRRRRRQPLVSLFSCPRFLRPDIPWRSGQKLTGVRSPALPTLGSHDLTLTSFVARTTPRCATDACPGDRSRRQVEEEEGSRGWGSKPCPSVLRESIGFPPAAIPLFLLLALRLLRAFLFLTYVSPAEWMRLGVWASSVRRFRAIPSVQLIRYTNL